MKNDPTDPILNLPVFKDPLPGPPIMTMDQYLTFVEFGLQHAADRDVNADQKRQAMVNVRFKIDPYRS